MPGATAAPAPRLIVRSTTPSADSYGAALVMAREMFGMMGPGTRISFEHGGWKGAAPEPVVEPVVRGWGHFVGSLRSFIETGEGQPW